MTVDMMTETHALPLTPPGGSRIRADRGISTAVPAGSAGKGTFENILYGPQATAESLHMPAPESEAEPGASDETGARDGRSDDDLSVGIDAVAAVDSSERKAPTSAVSTGSGLMPSQGQGVGSGIDAPTYDAEAIANLEPAEMKAGSATSVAAGSPEALVVSSIGGVSQSLRMPLGEQGRPFAPWSSGTSNKEMPAWRPSKASGANTEAIEVSSAVRGDQNPGAPAVGTGTQEATGPAEQQGEKGIFQTQPAQVPPGLKDSRSVARDASAFFTPAQASRRVLGASFSVDGQNASGNGLEARLRAISAGAAGSGTRGSVMSNREANTIIAETVSREEARLRVEGNRPEVNVDRGSLDWRDVGSVSAPPSDAGRIPGDRSPHAGGEVPGSLGLASHAVQSGPPMAHQGSGMTDGPAVLHGVKLGDGAATDMIRHLSRSPDGTIDVALDPVELGRVRMSLHPQADGVTVAISADRAETADLMRQHAGRLGEELRALGYESVSFSFSEDSGRNAQSLPETRKRDGPSGHMEPDGEVKLARAQPGRVVPGEGMDLRL